MDRDGDFNGSGGEVLTQVEKICAFCQGEVNDSKGIGGFFFFFLLKV